MGEVGRSRNNDRTAQYKIKSSRRARKEEDSRKSNKKRKKKHSKLKKAIIIFLAIILLLCLIAVGIVAGIFLSDKWALTKEELIANENTVVLDSKGKQIALLSATEGDGNRKNVTLAEMGKFTPNAYVAVEDKRFYEHDGVDILRTIKATVSYILHKTDGSSVGGGSTITQQLVKNLMNDDADTGKEGIERKIRELSRAYQLDKMLEKDEILEKYLNVIFVGGGELHGVEYGAQYYFAKSAKDLDLAESAFLAGINNAPNAYTPYDENNDNSEKIKSRTKYVLDCMKEQNRICEDDPEEAEKLYNEAVEKVEKGLKFKKGNIEFSDTTYFVAEALKEAATDLSKKKDISYKVAYDMIRGGGYKLYTTQDTTIQNTVIKEMAKKSYIEKKTIQEKNEKGKVVNKTIQTHAGITIIDFKKGKVVAMGGDFGSDKGLNYNYATSGRQTGSSIKPLANLASGLEEKVITASTIFDDTLTEFAKINNNISWKPKNAGGYQGLCTVRKAIEVSSNIVNVKMFHTVGGDKAVEYLNAFGLNSYTKEDAKKNSLAIGGIDKTSSTLEMAAAYAAIANDGVYIEPTFYEKLVDNKGEKVLEPEQETRRVISEANSFIIKDILMDVVTGAQGTANACYMSNIDVAAKTGTTEDDWDTWLCGFTPYYAAASWNGYGSNETMYNVGNARTLWANIMKTVHKDKKAARFEKPDNIVTAKVCRQSGKLATSQCGSTYTEYFVEGTVPKKCDGHTTIKICKETKMVANEYCPETEQRTYSKKPDMEQNADWKVLGSNKYTVPTEKCTKHTEETSKVTIVNVVGKTETEARMALAGLNIQVIYGHDSTQQDGIVLSQNLAEGTRVDKGVTITITVNKLTNSGENTGTTGSGNTGTQSGGNTGTQSGGNTGTQSGGGTTTNPETPTTPSEPNTPSQPTTPTTPTTP